MAVVELLGTALHYTKLEAILLIFIMAYLYNNITNSKTGS